MITKRALLAACILILPGSAEVMGGSGGGGSGPPAKEALELLLAREIGPAAGLYQTELGEIKLGVNRPLDVSLVLSMTKPSPHVMNISDADFESLAGPGYRSVDAITIGGSDIEKARSYIVQDSDSIGQLVLKDRRELARESVK